MPSQISIHPSEYPQAYRDNSIVDDMFGFKVTDPYRWLEDSDAEETKDFVKKLNSLSESFLKKSNVREKISENLTNLWDYEKYGCVSLHGDYYYYYYNSGLQNQWVYYRQKKLNGKSEVFLDLNTFSENGTTALQIQSWTDDGSLFAYGILEKGSDWLTIKFCTVAGENLPDVITGVKFSNLDWISTKEGVFYSKYKQETISSLTQKLAYHSLFYHKLGTDCKDDILIAEFPEDENFMISGMVSEDGRYLTVDVRKGCDLFNKLYYFDLESVSYKITQKLDLKPLFTKSDAKYSFVDNDDNSALILTNKNAPMFKLVRVKLSKECEKESEWEVIIPEDSERKLSWAAPVANDKLLVSYLENVKSTLYVHDLKTGKLLYQIPLEIGSFCKCSIYKNKSEFFFSFDSFLIPTIVYRGDFSSVSNSYEPIKLQKVHEVKICGIDLNDFAVDQVFYPSKDGTKIPMYIVAPKNINLNGSNPTLLSGYGGFSISILPSFSISNLCLMRYFKAIVACANLRGGSEYGEKWHKAGILHNKINVFDDFISGAEYLIKNKYTNPKKLAITGSSNGGLLMAVCSKKRPDLFAAVLNRVGVLDMIRFHKLTIGSAWLSEYGNPEIEEDFKFLIDYSPLHNIDIPKDCQFPSTLLITGDHDDRVVPSHTLKYIAQFYHLINTYLNWQRNPILAKIEVNAGHGFGKPTSKVIDEIVDMYCFLHLVLKLEWIN